MSEVKYRVDSRLIHGQVIARWSVKYGTEEIIIVDDLLADDDFMKDIYVMAAPEDISVEVWKVDEAAAKWNANEIADKNILVLFKDVAHALRLMQSGVAIDAFQIGGLPSGAERKLVYKTISLSKEDYNDLDEMAAGGTNVFFQMLPEEDPFPYDKVKR